MHEKIRHLFRITIIPALLLWPGLLAAQKNSGGYPLTAKVMDNGVVFVTDHSTHVAYIEPAIFTEGWKYHRITFWTQDSRFDGLCTLWGGERIGLKASVEILPSGIHIRYTLTPLDPVKVISAQTVIYLTYDAWLGAGYALGSSTGTIPKDPVPSHVIARADSGPLSLGAAHSPEGLSVQLEAKGLQTTLQDSRTWGSYLNIQMTHGEPSNKPWDWKAGEEKTYDFTLAFNRDISTALPTLDKGKEGFEGVWQGIAKDGDYKFRVATEIQKVGENKYSVHIDQPDQGEYGLVPPKIFAKDGSLYFDSDNGVESVLYLDSSGEVLQAVTRWNKNTTYLRSTRGLGYSVPRLDSQGHAVTHYAYQPPGKLSDGWETGDLEREKADFRKIEAAVGKILDGTYPHIDSLLVVHHGKLLLEEYFNGLGPDDEHQLRSITKSVFSTLFGIACDQGILKPDQKLYDFFPEYRSKPGWDAKKDRITLGMVLSMGSGFAYSDEDPPNYRHIEDMIKAKDWLSFCLSDPLSHEPGRHFSYSGTALIPLGAVLAKQSGLSVADFAQKYLYDPLGIQARHWWVGPDGTTEIEGSHCLRPRDMAKLGRLFLDKGKWKGKQVVSGKWVEEATKPRFFYKDTGGLADYGYLWWIEPDVPGGQNPHFYNAGGLGGQYIFVVPEYDLVCVMTGSNYIEGGFASAAKGVFRKYILAAFNPDEKTRISK